MTRAQIRNMPGATGSRSRLTGWLKITGVVILGIALALSLLLSRLSLLNRRWVEQTLRQHYNSNVELTSFHASWFPRVAVSGEGLTLSFKDRPGAPPLATIERFSADTTWPGLLRHPARVRHVRFDGLTINIPPRRQAGREQPEKKAHHLPPFYLEDLDADGTILNILPGNPQKPLRVFVISKLRLRSVGVGKAMSFHAALTIPKPVGGVETRGEFGPWNPADPGQTPVSGRYEFRDADLSTIRGIAGILSSQGVYGGVLGRIEVQGETTTPDFSLGIGRNREPLKTEFNAVVDGVTGNTLLEPVKAQLGHCLIVARGGVFRTTGVKGTTVSLKVTTGSANLRDLLRLAVESSIPPMTGSINLSAQLDLPPGQEDISKRLRLDGNFSIDDGRFTDPDVEAKITHLSQRGEGKPNQNGSERTKCKVRGRFLLSRGTLNFSSLSLEVPGASVDLQGTYGLLSEDLDFQGTLRLKAELSQTTTGIKSVLLKAANPLFKGKNAGTVVPIKITGKREHPVFRIQFGRLFRRLR